MRILAAGNRSARSGRGQSGLTLVELLIVLVIMALMSGFALLAVAREAGRAERDAERALAAMARLSDLAVAQARPYGFRLEGGQLVALRFSGDAWLPVGQPLRLDKDVTAALELSEDQLLPESESELARSTFFAEAAEDIEARKKRAPSVVFDPTGEVTPFTLRLGDGKARVIVEMDALGRATVSHADA